MRILYSIQATGNGHISRATQIAPLLEQYGQVDYLLSGTNCQLNPEIKVKYRLKGLSLFYNASGMISYKQVLRQNSLTQALKDAYHLPVKEYDLIINDFECITALACKIHGVKSIQFGHQASFQSTRVPRPEKRSLGAEWLLKYFATAREYAGLHFKSYDTNIFTPIIKRALIDAPIDDKGHITVYLPSIPDEKLLSIFKNLKQRNFHIFSCTQKYKSVEGNVHIIPVDDLQFTLSMIDSHGVLCGAGFETPSEALYLNKKLIVVPIINHYEQLSNAKALSEMNVTVINKIDETFASKIKHWIDNDHHQETITPNNISNTLQYVIQKGRRNYYSYSEILA